MHAEDPFKDGQLIELTPENCAVRAFQLRPRGRESPSVLILFTPEGLVLLGDLFQRGVMTTERVPIDWFAGDFHDDDALLGRFLVAGWSPSLAATHIRGLLERGVWSASLLTELMSDVSERRVDRFQVRDRLLQAGVPRTEVVQVGYGYPEGTADKIRQVQRHFARLRRDVT